MRYYGSKKLQNLVDSYSIDLGVSQYACGWGRKPSFHKAARIAAQHTLPLFCLEDGFIRSVGLGVQGVPPLSVVVDDLGIHFDATQASRLEHYIIENQAFDVQRIERAMHTIVTQRLTKYNVMTQPLAANLQQLKNAVLVIDQTYGDQSIHYSGADAARFQQMLEYALAEHPEANILLKIHPDVLAHQRKGHFALDQLPSRVICISENYNIYDLFALVNTVYVVSSQAGFEALLAGKEVHCFGSPWYAGWGLTHDHALLAQVRERRQVKRSLAALFYAAYYRYSRYFHPMDQKLCALETILELIVLNVTWRDRLHAPLTAVGFSRWKRQFIRDYVGDLSSRLRFLPAWRIPHQHTTQWLVWGKKHQAKLRPKQQQGDRIWRVEDGFIRSKGLGAQLIRPCSLVLDDLGIYYDATQPSRLEHLLNTSLLDAQQVQRGQQLIQLILDMQLTKYNIGVQDNRWLQAPHGKTVVLVPGQVEDDASIQLGGVDIKTNLGLLQAVRQARPDAWIVYKPHPDVAAKLRVGQVDGTDVYRYADQMVEDVSMISCLEQVDEVHTITSLTGFEALLRGRKVYCYGLPFYAGWGLTVDRHHCVRRQRQLSLPALVYIVLNQYALYNVPDLPKGIALVRAEDVMAYLQQQLQQQDMPNPHTAIKAGLARVRAAVLQCLKTMHLNKKD